MSQPPPLPPDTSPSGTPSGPVLAAVRWASIAATARTGDPVVVPDGIDLVAGIALALPGSNPLQVLLDHFEIPLGAVLTDGGSRSYTRAAVLEAAAAGAPDLGPPTSGEVAEILRSAARIPSPAVGSLDTLFGAVLESTGPAAAAIRGRLAERGADPDAVVASYRSYLDSFGPYADFLTRNHPRRPLELPPFAADEPLRRKPDRGDRPTGGGDLVGITAEIDAFAYLIASRRLVPPLAVGLFGNWGSGKSYFLRSLQRRIDAITSSNPRLDPDRFQSAVVQIEFNAWQYVEGDLWASLLEHLFRNLRTSPDDSDDLLSQRHRYWVKKVDDAAARQLKARTDRAELERRQQEAVAEVGRRRAQRDVRLAELERQQRERPLAGFTPSDELLALRTRALDETGLTGVATEATGLAAELGRSAEMIREAGRLSALIRAKGRPFFAALAVVLLAVPGTALLLSAVDPSGASAVAATVSWLLATGAGYLKLGNDALRAALDKVRDAQMLLTQETAEARKELETKIATAERALADVTDRLGHAEAEEVKLEREAGWLRTQLASITPSSVMSEFIAERTGSDDYRRRLGIPAVVRRDLERLSLLVADQKVAGGTHAIERVVLYVDDLDRCPTKLVIKVLEAVHLLLAFPLFVVVVAVDSRWLESSLRQHYPQLRARGGAPADYLEKIFQVPFWVRPVDAATRRRVVHGLLAPSLRAAEAAPVAGDLPPALVSEADRPAFDRAVASLGDTELPNPTWTGAADLSVTAEELGRLEDLAELVGATPRTLKRFVNVYLLVKAMGLGQGWSLPGGGEVALLLAMSTAVPDLVVAVLAAPEPGVGTSLQARIEAADRHFQQQGRMLRWLADNPRWRDMEMGGIGRWAEPIRRFTFADSTQAE